MSGITDEEARVIAEWIVWLYALNHHEDDYHNVFVSRRDFLVIIYDDDNMETTADILTKEESLIVAQESKLERDDWYEKREIQPDEGCILLNTDWIKEVFKNA